MIQLNEKCLHRVNSLDFQTSVVINVFLKKRLSLFQGINVAFANASIFCYRRKTKNVNYSKRGYVTRTLLC